MRKIALCLIFQFFSLSVIAEPWISCSSPKIRSGQATNKPTGTSASKSFAFRYQLALSSPGISDQASILKLRVVEEKGAEPIIFTYKCSLNNSEDGTQFEEFECYDKFDNPMTFIVENGEQKSTGSFFAAFPHFVINDIPCEHNSIPKEAVSSAFGKILMGQIQKKSLFPWLN